MGYHRRVKRLTIPACAAILVVGPIDLLRADVTEPKDSEYYQVILDRNPFALRAPMAPPPELTNPPPVKVDVKITGVTAHSGVKKAWLMIPAVAGKSPNPRYLSMMEGDKDGDLQVLEINEKDATVKVLNAGVPVVLNFRENGLAAPTALAVAGPTAGGVVPPGIRPPGLNPTPGVPQPGAGATYSPTPANTVVPGANQPSAEIQPNTGIRTIPSRNLRTTPAPTAPVGVSTEAAAQPAVDPAVQYIQLKAQERAAALQGIQMPPLPNLGSPE
jgi:hypothetical protein